LSFSQQNVRFSQGRNFVAATLAWEGRDPLMTLYQTSILEDHGDIPAFDSSDFQAVVDHLKNSTKRLHFKAQQEKTTRWFNAYAQTKTHVQQWHTMS
jgi:hypothetical protein